MGAFADAAAAAFSTFQALEGVEVLYCRGGGSVSITAIVGRTVAEIDDITGVALQRTESRDYLIRAAELVLSAQAITPAPGDKIRERIGGVETVWELTPLGIEPCHRFSDPECTVLRVHTKRAPTT